MFSDSDYKFWDENNDYDIDDIHGIHIGNFINLLKKITDNNGSGEKIENMQVAMVEEMGTPPGSDLSGGQDGARKRSPVQHKDIALVLFSEIIIKWILSFLLQEKITI